ncbi:unnamed protein product [Closterium sp. NIES-54]
MIIAKPAWGERSTPAGSTDIVPAADCRTQVIILPEQAVAAAAAAAAAATGSGSKLFSRKNHESAETGVAKAKRVRWTHVNDSESGPGIRKPRGHRWSKSL